VPSPAPQAGPAAPHAGCPAFPAGNLWVFGYGSLMWDPGFEFLRSAPALLRGYHRAFCVYSVRFRGTPEQPGLVLGLDRGGACRGMGFLVAQENVSAAIAQLWAREMPRLVYRPRLIPIDVEGHKVRALAFTADPAHESYAGRLDPERVAQTIACCSGAGGPNVDYLANTLRHLKALGIRERRLHRLLLAVQAMVPRT
jgi:cation transport protein ChaC